MTKVLHFHTYYFMIMEFEERLSILSKENINHLRIFGLSEEEARVYLSLLNRGSRGEVVGRIKDKLEIGRTTIYAIMERLTKKEWISSMEISENPKRIKYTAKPPFEIMNNIIQKKEFELKLIKQSNLLIGDTLEKIHKGAINLNINTVHAGAYKYLRPLVKQKFKIKSEVIEHLESEEKVIYDYELKGPNGFPKECGLVIFNYSKDIENNKFIIGEAIEMFKKKTEYEIRKHKIPGFEDIVFENITIGNYPCINVYFKLKLKKKPWLVGKEGILPIKNKIFLIHGNSQNFEILFNTIINSEKFHHIE